MFTEKPASLENEIRVVEWASVGVYDPLGLTDPVDGYGTKPT